MNALIFLIETFGRLYLLTFLLRILLQVARADFYNPLAQFIVGVTNPLVVPARRFIPSVGRFDMPTFVILFVLQTIIWLLILGLSGNMPRIDRLLWLVVFTLASMTLWTYIICIFVWALLSWIGQRSYSPFARLLGQLVDPILRPARRLLPPIGGLDISPLIVSIFLMAGIIALGDLSRLVM